MGLCKGIPYKLTVVDYHKHSLNETSVPLVHRLNSLSAGEPGLASDPANSDKTPKD